MRPSPWLTAALATMTVAACAPAPGTPATAPLESRLSFTPGRRLTYETTTYVDKVLSTQPNRSTYEIVALEGDEDFRANYSLTGRSGKTVSGENAPFTRLYGIFWAEFTPFHPKPSEFTESELLEIKPGKILAQRTSRQQERPDNKLKETYTYWVANNVLLKQTAIRENGDWMSTELVAIE